MVSKKKVDEENKIILKLSNRWEFFGYVLKYRSKEILAILLFLAIILLIFQNSNISVNGLIDSMFRGVK